MKKINKRKIKKGNYKAFFVHANAKKYRILLNSPNCPKKEFLRKSGNHAERFSVDTIF